MEFFWMIFEIVIVVCLITCLPLPLTEPNTTTCMKGVKDDSRNLPYPVTHLFCYCLLAPPHHPAPLLRLPIASLLEGYLDVCSSLPPQTTTNQTLVVVKKKSEHKKRKTDCG